ncbi:HAD family hydrolase [Allostreptomyces psammosilenae]|uniref:Putative hydrolase of the HAD superfamily n=1 Tax=Allostreptomyces psammosilenae TaxID=1892865 RepID=A0A852ZUU9_9ACTN|nr:HAD family phosphatase [Allostreptomyces psammosilenae]NYI05367.1 putative hydrolase of the HAD superfamily [Allostreptomyces psammosilenae]
MPLTDSGAGQSLPGTAPVDVLVCDYGGVLTNPLIETFTTFSQTTGLSLEALGGALAAHTEKYGKPPMAALEVAEITEAEFVERLLPFLPEEAAEVLSGQPFGELWFRGRLPNQELIDFLKELREGGVRLAMLTNNVVEWRPRWRAQMPVDELFELVVDSSEEKVRKPDPEIYQRLVSRLGVPAERVLLLDDTEENLVAAREQGLQALLFQDTAQAVAGICAALGIEVPERFAPAPVEDLTAGGVG